MPGVGNGVLELLLPTTDTAVAIQAGVLAVVGAVALVLTRKNPDARLFAWGAVLCGFAFIGVRALH